MYWTDGTIYKGEWADGSQHGMGKMIQPDGTVLEGYFEDNLYVGPLPPADNDGEVIVEEILEDYTPAKGEDEE
jgi:hypothetical protein